MRKRTLLILVSMLTFTLSLAQEGNQSRAILNKAYTAFEASEGICLTFTLSMLDLTNTPIDVQTGEAYTKGNKFKLDTEAMTIWFDGKTQWVLMKEVNEVNISQPTEQEVASISPLALLGIYKEGYTLAPPVTTTVNGKQAYRIDMAPTSNRGDFQSVSVTIDPTNHALTRVILTGHDGMKTRIDIIEYNANQRYQDSHFTFNASAYPDVEIVDLR
ncbi:MAG: LolA family protein [Fermentimonas sp.]|jgi:outer membrane lipoprotein-sorting protein